MERFRVERVLGQGGMGQVLAAYDTLRGRRVALKRMRSDRPGEVRRLKEEFRALSDLAGAESSFDFTAFVDEVAARSATILRHLMPVL